MKAIAVFPGRREVKLIDHEEPKITTPMQVKLRTLEVGVCGTDKKITSFQFGTPPAGYDYFIIGHEMLGEVVEVGSAVRDFEPGDLAVAIVRHSCPHEYCRACRLGHQDSSAGFINPQKSVCSVFGHEKAPFSLTSRILPGQICLLYVIYDTSYSISYGV